MALVYFLHGSGLRVRLAKSALFSWQVLNLSLWQTGMLADSIALSQGVVHTSVALLKITRRLLCCRCEI